MKKKFIATLVAGAVLSTGVMGLTACGGLSVPKGEEVADAAAWKTAFDRTDDLTNYSAETSASMTANIEGTVTTVSGCIIENKKQSYTIQNSMTGSCAIDADNDTLYIEGDYTNEKKGTVDGKEQDDTSSAGLKTYFELREQTDSGKTYWQATYSKNESKSLETVTSTENLWKAASTSYFINPTVFDTSNDSFYADYNATDATSLSALYERFTYSDGVYTAALYREIKVEDIAEDKVPCTVTISIKDGYVIGLNVKIDAKKILYKKEAYDIVYTYKHEETTVLKDIKSTDVSKKANKDIKKAIEKAKADEENS